ncbi:hypothetical protein DD594_27080, partial [Enterobacter cloacae complex sp. 4DZ1-17B1]|uniref:hypothetical protein n=1 Tax=Enterobacter cloacae complex sp. 4DZ1-17B1 TaxID=2511991 RepID=UPI001027C876
RVRVVDKHVWHPQHHHVIEACHVCHNLELHFAQRNKAKPTNIKIKMQLGDQCGNNIINHLAECLMRKTSNIDVQQAFPRERLIIVQSPKVQ